MRWYNPATRFAESVPAPYTDEEATHMLRGAIDSWAFLMEYERLREEGMGVEQAMIFVGYRFGIWHPRYHRGTNPWACARPAQAPRNSSGEREGSL